MLEFYKNTGLHITIIIALVYKIWWDIIDVVYWKLLMLNK